MNITQRTLVTLRPTGSPRFLRDDKLLGFGIKVTAKGKASYIVEARVKGGRTVRKTIGNVDHISLDDARSEARGLLHKLKTGVDIAKEKPPAPPEPNSLQDVFDRYLKTRVKLRASTRQNYSKIMRNCFADLLRKDVEQISKDDIADQYAKLRQRTSEAYAGGALRILKAVLNSTGLTVNPVSHFQKASGVSSVSKARTRYLSADEIVEILEFAKQADFVTHRGHEHFEFCQLLAVYLHTGLRKNEALNLRKSDVDLMAETMTIRETKNGRELVLPLTGSLKAIIQRQMKLSNSEKLWNYTENEYRGQLARTQAALPIKAHWTTHDLRRTFAEHCQLMGIDENVIAACLNHSPVTVTRKNYLGGGLAKKAMIRDVYERLEEQYLGYYFGMSEKKIEKGQRWFS